MASTDSERRLVLVLCADPGAEQFYMVLYILIHFTGWFKAGVLNVYVCGLISWWQVQTQKERRLVLVSCTDPGAVQFYMVLYILIHFASWFKAGVLNVYVCGVASWWQVQTQQEDWFWLLSHTLVWCNLAWSYTASSILPTDSRHVFIMCMFVNWYADGKYRLGKMIGSGILYRPCSAVLHGLIQHHPFACAFKTDVLNVNVCELASWWQVQTWKEIGSGFLYILQTMVWYNFAWSNTSSSSLQVDSRQVLLMCMFVD